jgi:hypothetical protein
VSTIAPRRLIYVPGIKPKPAPEIHATVLRECLLAGVQRSNDDVAASMAASSDWLRLVSWGHVFYPDYRDLAQDRPGIDALLQAPPPADAVPEITPRLRLLSYRLGDRFPALISWLAGPGTAINLRDTRRYFANRRGEADRVRGLVAAALEAAWAEGARVMLMAHSLGSVIAWETLLQLSRRPGGAGAVDVFLTLGSPLGTRYIRTRLKHHTLPPLQRYPRGIQRWRNLSAQGDLTALDHAFAEDFAEMESLGLVAGISDRLDLVNGFVGTEGPNPHRCYGYFVHPETGVEIARWWQGERA